MQPELYISLKEQKVIREAALRSGVSRGVMQACWDAGKVYGLMVCRGGGAYFTTGLKTCGSSLSVFQK